MEKRKITARDILKDIRAGVDDSVLMKRYSLSAQGLQSVFNKMVQARIVSEEELDARVPLSARTVDIGLFICPACGNIRGKEFTECPRCGFIPLGPAKREKTLRPDEAKPKSPSKSKSLSPRQSKESSAESANMSPALESYKPPQSSKETGSTNLRSIIRYCRILGTSALISYILVAAGLLGLMQSSVPQGLLTFAQSLLGVLILGIPVIVIGLAILILLRALAESMAVLENVSNLVQDKAPQTGYQS